jgi:outer membrane murein-binding lipoprotein Lpp
MAQDFYAAFHVGADDRHITSIDESGVALAAIKALSAEKASLQSTYVTLQRDRAALHTEVTAQRTDNARLRARLDALEAQVAALAQR